MRNVNIRKRRHKGLSQMLLSKLRVYLKKYYTIIRKSANKKSIGK